MTIVLGVLAAGGLVAAVWLAVSRGRLAAAAAVGERASAERDRLAGEVEAARGQAAKWQVEAAALRERTEGMEREHEAEMAGAGRAHVAEIETMRRLCDQSIAKEKDLAAAQVRSAAQAEERTRKYVEDLEKRFKEAFGSLAGEALTTNREQFLALAEQKLEAKRGAVDELVKPIAETLKRTDEKLAVIEQAGSELRSETGKLVRALREPHVRGRYGEIQLKRVAELAGMIAYCDFSEQEQTRDIEGNPLRPDMVVKMPSGRTVVVDAKTNIQAYLDAIGAATPAEADACLDRFARHVAEQAAGLARKKYWAQYEGSPEFVVMFIPGDQFVDAALSRQPEILENAAQQGVILASPATLIGLLRAVAVGYKEHQLASAAAELRELGKELHERVAVAMSHAAKLGRSLNGAVESYNDFVGSYERRLEPVLRRFEEGGVKSAKELPEVGPVVVSAREAAPNAGLLAPGPHDGQGASSLP